MKKIPKLNMRKLTEAETRELMEVQERQENLAKRLASSSPVIRFPISPHALRFSHEEDMDEIILRHEDEQDCMVGLHMYMSRTLSMIRLRKGKLLWMYNEFPMDIDTALTVFNREAVKYEELTDDQQHFYSDAHAYEPGEPLPTPRGDDENES